MQRSKTKLISLGLVKKPETSIKSDTLSPLENIFSYMKDELPAYLGISAIGNLRQVSSASLKFFSLLSPVQSKAMLTRDFGITEMAFAQFETELNKLNLQYNYQQLYKNIRIAFHRSNLLDDKEKKKLLSATNQIIALAVCSDEGGAFLGRILPQDENAELCLKLAIAGDCLRSISYLIEPQNPYGLSVGIDTALKWACKSGHGRIPQYLIQNGNLKISWYMLSRVALYGDFATAKYLLESPSVKANLKVDRHAVYSACVSGHSEMVKYFLDKNNNRSQKRKKRILARVAVSGNLTLLKALLTQKNILGWPVFEPDQVVLEKAASSGNLEMVVYLISNFNLRPTFNTLKEAINSGKLDLVRYLLDSANNFSFIHKDERIQLTGLDYNIPYNILSYLLDSANSFNFIPTHGLLLRKAESGDFEGVRLLLAPRFGFRPDAELFKKAIKSGNIELAEWLSELLNRFQGATLPPGMLSIAAQEGHFEVLSFLLNPLNEFNLVPTIETLRLAAKSGNSQMILFLLNPENNFVFDLQLLNIDGDKKDINFPQRRILKSARLISEALTSLHQNEFKKAHSLFIESSRYSLRHCFQVIAHAYLQPATLLSGSSQLMDIMEAILDQSHPVPVELETIYSLLLKMKSSSLTGRSLSQVDKMLDKFTPLFVDPAKYAVAGYKPS